MVASRRDLPFHEWQQEMLRKTPARGGIQSPVAPASGFAPGAGLSQRDTRPLGVSESQYASGRPLGAPDPWVDDVDMGSNFFSPMQPVWPFGPPNVQVPREWDYPTGYNLNFIQPRMELMGMLRGMARTWGVIATIVATRQDQLLRIPWTIQKRNNPRQKSAAVVEMQKFFKRPDGKLGYGPWCRKLLFDLLELDAPTIYFARNRSGKPLSAEVLSGQTVFPIIDDAGRRPDSVVEWTDDGMQYLRRQPAFQQIIKGLPMVDLDESELMYVPMRPRPDMPMFGYPPTEQILVEASEAVRKTFYQLDFWAEGTIPDLVVTVPTEWSPRQIAMFQAHFDAMLSGNLKLKSKVRFLPGGMKPFDIKNSSGESLWSQRDETLIRLACYAFSTSPTPFIKPPNRSVATQSQTSSDNEGLYPLMAYWKDEILDPIIQDRFGYDDVEAVFLPAPEPDQEKAAKIHDLKIKSGEITINEARAEAGQEPVPGGDKNMIYIGNAIIPLEMAATGKALPGAGMGADSGGGDGEDGNKENPSGNKPSGARPVSGANAGPLRGPARSPRSVNPVAKASKSELRAASRRAQGHVHNYSGPQLEAGNYPMGHVWIQGLNISIENAPGSLRGKKDSEGNIRWANRMPVPYGYIRGTEGADGDHLDVFLGPRPAAAKVWIIDQHRVSKKGKVKGFDEHKIMLGFKSLRLALRAYAKANRDNFGLARIECITEMSVGELKRWMSEGDTASPCGAQGFGRVVLTRDELAKLDTISSATNILWRDSGTKRKTKRKKRPIRQGPRWLELSA